MQSLNQKGKKNLSRVRFTEGERQNKKVTDGFTENGSQRWRNSNESDEKPKEKKAIKPQTPIHKE